MIVEVSKVDKLELVTKFFGFLLESLVFLKRSKSSDEGDLHRFILPVLVGLLESDFVVKGDGDFLAAFGCGRKVLLEIGREKEVEFQEDG